eukprot:jgi/Chlat1/5042/Chrsp329S04915
MAATRFRWSEALKTATPNEKGNLHIRLAAATAEHQQLNGQLADVCNALRMTQAQLNNVHIVGGKHADSFYRSLKYEMEWGDGSDANTVANTGAKTTSTKHGSKKSQKTPGVSTTAGMSCGRRSTRGKRPTKGSKRLPSQASIARQSLKPHRFRPGTVALKEIRKYQKTTDLLLRKHLAGIHAKRVTLMPQDMVLVKHLNSDIARLPKLNMS